MTGASGHKPRKRFGQHFLVDEGVVEAMVRAIAPKPGQSIIEIGPGQGVLTRPLLAACGSLTVIEIDRDLAAALPGQMASISGELKVINGDVLHYPFDGQQLRVVGNLPYNISTPLLFHLFEHQVHIQDMHFMMQKEVVARLVAQPGDKNYSRLTVMAQCYAEMDHLFDVPPEAFEPPPKVNSAVMRLRPKALSAAELGSMAALEQVTRQAFAQRRKTLRNALSVLMAPEAILALGIDPGARAQTLSLDEFRRLAEYIQANPEP